VLQLKNNSGPFDFSCILPLYKNLNVLRAVGMGKITDAFVSQIVTAGGLANLTELVIVQSVELSI
jgi:hypothetical protein